MTAKGYAQIADVQGLIPQTLTGAQQAEANALVEAAESVIDAYCGRSWLETIANEEYILAPGQWDLRLRRSPATLTSVAVWSGTALQVLTVDTQYQVRPNGLIRLFGWYSQDIGFDVVWSDWGVWDTSTRHTRDRRVYVSYSVGAVPAAVRQAAAMLVRAWLQPLLLGVPGDVQSLTIPGDFAITYRALPAMQADSLPAEVQLLLAPYRRTVFA